MLRPYLRYSAEADSFATALTLGDSVATYSQDIIEQVRDAANIVEIIGQYTELKPSGHQYMGRCPFPDHPEKTPSFSVSESKQVYHCFGCKKSGNVFSFLESFSGMNFPQAVEYLARRHGIALPETLHPKDQARESSEDAQKDLALEINRRAANYFNQIILRLPKDHPVVKYCLSRKLDEECIREFQIGFAPDSWDGLTHQLIKAKVDLKLTEQLGLIKLRTGGKSGHYDFFRERLMFPILSPMGEVIGFGGRAVGDGQPKYLNSPENRLFSKGKAFYLSDRATKYMRTEDTAIIVEGYMDAIAMHQAGFTNTVAVLGTALTREHARWLKRHVKKVILLFDSDKAGQQAARNSLPILLNEELFVYTIQLHSGKDPDEFLATTQDGVAGPARMRELIRTAPELFYVLLQHRMHEYQGTPSDKVAVLDEFGDVLRATSDQRLRSLYIEELAEQLNVTPQWVARGLTQSAKRAPLVPPSRANITPSTTLNAATTPSVSEDPPPRWKLEKGARKAEILLLNLALKRPELLVEALLQDVTEKMNSNALRESLRFAESHYRQKPEDFDKLTNLLTEKIDPSSAVTRHLEPAFAESSLVEDRKLLHDCIQNIHDNKLKAEAQALQQRLRQPSHTDELEQFMNIVKARRALKGAPPG